MEATRIGQESNCKAAGSIRFTLSGLDLGLPSEVLHGHEELIADGMACVYGNSHITSGFAIQEPRSRAP